MRARAVIAFVLLVCAACKQQEMARDNERELKRQLAEMRGAIAAYHKDNGRYPTALIELVPTYLRAIPVDPMTSSYKSWQVITEDTVQPNSDFTTATSEQPKSVIIDVRSGAGAPYSTY